MTVHDSSVRILEAAIDHAPHERRVENLRRVTDLFIAGADCYSEEAVIIFDRLLRRLIEDIETAVLVEIGQLLAPIKKAPAGVVRTLARHDEIAVAGPLLTQSERLAEADLIDVAETKSQAHLMAISNRVRIEPSVTDVLVRRGDDEVVRTLAANAGATFSPHGMDTLADRAERDEVLAEKVVQRVDVPHHIFCKLLVAATGVVRERLLAVLAPEAQEEAFRVLEKVSGAIADHAPAPRSYGNAIRRVLIESADGQLGERELVKYAATQQIEETIAALSLMASVPTERIDEFLTTGEYESLLAVCKAADLSFQAARAVIQLDRFGGTTSLELMNELSRKFEQITSTEAQRLVQLWQVDR
jgi:uncharacterized protein (DUF2336 family)